MTCICSVSISGARYWHLGQHNSGSSSGPAAPWSPTGTKAWLRNDGAGGTVLKAAHTKNAHQVTHRGNLVCLQHHSFQITNLKRPSKHFSVPTGAVGTFCVASWSASKEPRVCVCVCVLMLLPCGGGISGGRAAKSSRYLSFICSIHALQRWQKWSETWRPSEQWG